MLGVEPEDAGVASASAGRGTSSSEHDVRRSSCSAVLPTTIRSNAPQRREPITSRSAAFAASWNSPPA